MESKIAGIPFIAIVFVLLTSICVAVLVSLYLTLFIFNQQTVQLNRMQQELQVLLLAPTTTVTPTPTVVVSPTVAVLKVPVKTVTKPATTSAK